MRVFPDHCADACDHAHHILLFWPDRNSGAAVAENLISLSFGVVDFRCWLAGLPGSGSISIHDAFIALLATSGIVLLAWRDAQGLRIEDPPPR